MILWVVSRVLLSDASDVMKNLGCSERLSRNC